MYVRIVLGSLRPETWDQYERHYKERVVPLTVGTKGLSGRKLLRSTEDPDQGISLSL